MILVQSVYEAVKNLANKDQKGFITPDQFNSFAKIAQLNIYYELFREFVEGKKLRRSNFDGARAFSLVERSKNDLAVFAEKKNLTKGSDGFKKPYDYSMFISCNINNSSSTPIHILTDEDKVNHLLNSTLSAPSDTFPVALMSDTIEVFPSTVKKITLRYYREPKVPVYQARIINIPSGASFEAFQPEGSVNFELPYHYEQELVAEIAKMVGINLKDVNLYNAAQYEEKRQ
jgi:hypothetical protein